MARKLHNLYANAENYGRILFLYVWTMTKIYDNEHSDTKYSIIIEVGSCYFPISAFTIRASSSIDAVACIF